MRNAVLIFICLVSSTFILTAHGEVTPVKQGPEPSIFIPWIMNSGQFANDAAFLKRTHAADIWVLRNRTIVYDLGYIGKQRIRIEEKVHDDISLSEIPFGNQINELKISYLGKSYNAGTPGVEAETFNQLDFGYIRKGIKMQLDARYGNVEKLLIMEPGTDVGSLRFELSGAEDLWIDEGGQLVIIVNGEHFKFTKPVAWQIGNTGTKETIGVSYLAERHKGKLQYGFEVWDHDPNRTLFIDPLISSSFFGGGKKDVVQQIKAGSNQNIYVAGVTESPDLFSQGTFDNSFNGQTDVFAAVFNQDLSSLLRMTYLGGTRKDTLGAMVLDKNNHVYLVGTTASADFPVTSNAFSSLYPDTQTNISDIFVACLNSKIDSLVSSTFLGSDREDKGNSIDITQDGNVFIAGMSAGKMPEVGPQWQALNTGMVFAKMDANLQNLLATNSIGAFGKSRPTDIAVDSSGQLFVTGFTNDNQFPVTPGCFSANLNGGNDAFVIRVKNDLSSLLAGSYVGGLSDDYAYTLLVDTFLNVYLAGQTRSPNFPVNVNAYDPTFALEDQVRYDAFICMMDSLLRKVISGTFFGSNGNQAIFDIVRDSTGNIVFAGYTNSPGVPVFCYSWDDAYNGGEDAFIGLISDKLQWLQHSTFLGGTQNERAHCIDIDQKNTVYVGGSTTSANFPAVNGYDSNFNGGERDGFLGFFSSLSQLEPCCSDPVFPPAFAVDQPTTLTIRWTKAWGAEGYFLSIGTAEGVFDILYHEDVGDNTFYEIEDLPCGKTIYVYIHPYNKFLTNLYCDYFSFSTVEPIIEEQEVDICMGESYFWKGQYYNQSGYYVIEEDNGHACPDIFSLNLKVNKVYEFTTIHEMCFGDTMYWQGEMYTEGGYFKKKYQTVFGCDSTFILDLWVFPEQSYYVNLTICAGDTLNWHGQSLFATGDYLYIKTNANGCEEKYHLHLVVDQAIVNTNAQICEGSSYLWHGLTYTESGEYEYIIPVEEGCDTVCYLNLSVVPTLVIIDSLVLCETDDYIWHGIPINEEGNYSYLIENEFSCDTLFLLNVQFLSAITYIEEVSACEGDTLQWHGMEITAGGTYEWMVLSTVGCDTVYQIVVDYVEIDNSVTNDSENIYAVFDPGATYQWVNCVDLTPIPGATCHIYSPENCDTPFAVVINKADCSEVSECICLAGTQIPGLHDSKIRVFPNPSDGRMHLALEDQTGKRFHLFIRDITGRIVFETVLSTIEQPLDLSSLPAGTYVLNVVVEQSVFQVKVVITR